MDSSHYQQKKQYFDRLLTVCGRKPALEALDTPSIKPVRLHLSEKNRPAKIIDDLLRLAEVRGVEVHYHPPKALSRISKNAKQDQGVALDIECPNFFTLETLLSEQTLAKTIIALDRITNPQNLGMIIRSVAASSCKALILPRKGCSPLNALVIKASAGTLFRAPLVRVESLDDALTKCRGEGYAIASLRADAEASIFKNGARSPTVFVLGNETDGVSDNIQRLCDTSYQIPMQRGVESLNVAVAASLIAFRDRS